MEHPTTSHREVLKETSDETLQICSVYYSQKSKAVLELNGEIARELNPGASFVWHAMDNSPTGDSEPLHAFPPGFSRMRGVSYEELGPLSAPHTKGSFQHASAVHKFLRAQNARFVLILDYDFFIIRPNWIRDVLAHMKKNNLSFFGSVWHPRYYAKYRYFPSVHCMFIDCGRVNCPSLDFRPDPESRSRKKSPPGRFWRMFCHLPWAMQRIFLAATFQDRQFIGSSRDTGYRLFREYGLRPDARHEEIQPVFKPREHFGRFASFFYYPNKFAEWFLPDRMSFIPQKKGYFSKKGFCDFGHPENAREQKEWEEYLWQGAPFGIHLRGTKAEKRKFDTRGAQDECASLRNFFSRFLEPHTPQSVQKTIRPAAQ